MEDTLNQATTVINYLGLVAFAVSGALAASRKTMDIFGFILLGTVTGIGGGTVRDLLLDLPVFWIEEPANLLTCVGVSVLVFFTAHIPQSRYKLLLLVDAIGLALFAAAGAERAVLAGADPSVAIAMGCITATFGGIIRDMLGAESPVVLSQEIYVTAAFAGSVIMVVGLSLDLPRAPCLITAFMVTLVIRLAAIRWNLALPRYKPRPGRAPEDIES